jgi:diketogulonate reductase-like aldo/keto reductase
MKIQIGDRKVSAVGQGTYGFGGYFGREHGHERALVEALRLGYSLGMTLVDTAEVYGSGLSEEIVGKSIEGLDRESIYIATKVWRNHLSYDSVIKSCKKSLERMKVKKIDLYQIHWPDSSTPLKETMKAFEALVDQGLISDIGVSNFSVKQMKEAIGALSKNELKSNQLEYSLDHREIEREVIPFCKENKIAVIAYSPLGTGELLHGAKSKALSEVAKTYGKTMAQVALNWIYSKGAISIPKASNIQHVKENALATDFQLSEQDIGYLESN